VVGLECPESRMSISKLTYHALLVELAGGVLPRIDDCGLLFPCASDGGTRRSSLRQGGFTAPILHPSPSPQGVHAGSTASPRKSCRLCRPLERQRHWSARAGSGFRQSAPTWFDLAGCAAGPALDRSYPRGSTCSSSPDVATGKTVLERNKGVATVKALRCAAP
jgi:hypothetical protein